ncbi:MAG: hypothetical protein WBX11_13185, partial [Thiobacillaceae bacterium]
TDATIHGSAIPSAASNTLAVIPAPYFDVQRDPVLPTRNSREAEKKVNIGDDGHDFGFHYGRAGCG